jgi:hypothetical protein
MTDANELIAREALLCERADDVAMFATAAVEASLMGEPELLEDARADFRLAVELFLADL